MVGWKKEDVLIEKKGENEEFLFDNNIKYSTWDKD